MIEAAKDIVKTLEKQSQGLSLLLASTSDRKISSPRKINYQVSLASLSAVGSCLRLSSNYQDLLANENWHSSLLLSASSSFFWLLYQSFYYLCSSKCRFDILFICVVIAFLFTISFLIYWARMSKISDRFIYIFTSLD